MAERKRPVRNIIEFPKESRAAPIRRLIPHRLRDARKAKRMTQGRLGEIIGVTRQAISAYESGEKSPDSETFTHIVDALEQPPAFFTTDNLSVFGEEKPRFFRKCGPETLRKNEACEILGRWFVQTVKYYDEYVNFPEVNVPESTATNQTESYSLEEIESTAEVCRQEWGLGVGPISNMLALLESKGIVVCRYEMENEKIDAFSFWNGGRPFIFMASDKESVARHRYDLAHELGHLILHKWVEEEELKIPKILKRIEAEADTFAGAFLLPRRSFPNEVYTSRLDAFVELKKRWRVSIQSMIYRCLNLEIIDADQFTNLYKQISFRKWRTSEPLDDPSVMPLEQPKLLRRAVELIFEGKRKHPNEVLSDLNFSTGIIEDFCNLPRGMFNQEPYDIFDPSLK
jgi:Zn-dependent peptidase ImmA (M78 family)/transcriptional regulator with XRE-family HTH domain